MLIFKSMTVAALLAAVSLAGGAEFSLIRDGKPDADILHSASKQVTARIAFFNDAVYRCTGTTLPVVQKAEKNRNTIVINLVNRPVESNDEYTIDFPDKRTMRITATEHSVSAAFCHLLEEYFGVRFLFVPAGTPYKEDINHYPAVKNASVPVRTVKKSASFNLKRQIDWKSTVWQMRWNDKIALDTEHMISYYVFPVYKYALDQSWPKNVMPTLADGKKTVLPKAKGPLPKNKYHAMRGYTNWNPCFSHPDTTRIAIENLLEYLKKNPKSDNVCLGINDCGYMCLCDACRKAVGGKRTQTGHLNYSPLYWKWVNDVANAVTAQYPHVFITALAYREVMEPPEFKLNKKVLPELCFELTAMNDPEVRARRMKLLEGWSKAAAQLDLWDYSYGVEHYLFPRIYFKSHSKWLETIHQSGTRGIFVECDATLPFEGPKHYLMAKKLYDIHADPEKIVMDWITAAVGKKSAPYLRQYYQFWEDYWTGPDIQKTAWYRSRFSIYMLLNEVPHHTLALKRGDMKKLRSLMEKVVANTETPQQKKRADILMQMFELSECAAKALFSEILQPDATLRNAADAAELLRQVPEAVKAYEKLLKNPYVKYFRMSEKIQMGQLADIDRVRSFLNNPEVKAEAVKLASDPAVPISIRGLLKIWMGAKPKNLIANGSFENPSPLPEVRWHKGRASRSMKFASDGDYSFRVPPFSGYAYHITVDPEKNYLFMFDAYIKKTSVEGNANFQLTTMSGQRHNLYHGYAGNKLVEGKWITLSGIGKVGTLSWHKPEEDYGIQLMIYMRNFEADDEIYIDNVRAYCLDDLK